MKNNSKHAKKGLTTKVIVTGGAGFIGCNVAKFHIARGDRVVLLDDLSRYGSGNNLEWLQKAGKLEFIKQDVADYNSLKTAINSHKDADIIYHMAGQVAVTISVADPRRDFEVNAKGTFNLLEAVRTLRIDPVIIYASTNKVYGEMAGVKIVEKNGRYQYADLKKGISENMPLDFYSPYGCSKGCADQYIMDYTRIYGLKTVSMRQSCIYGIRQFGVEDQGWVMHFIISAILGKPVTIYGDGKQVRDILYIDDLIRAFQAAYRSINKIKGMAFNIGGGANNQMSILELVSMLEDKLKRKIKIKYAAWRPGDQRIYISNTEKVRKLLGWEPKVPKEEGIDMLINWAKKNKEMFI